MLNSRYLILYTDEQGQNRFTECNDDKYTENGIFDTAAFIADHPNMRLDGSNTCHIIGIHDTQTDLLNIIKREEEMFRDYCGMYGFAFDDYRRRVRNPISQCEGLFIGFLPQNRKYKALIRDVVTGRLTKASLSYVRKYMI